MKWISIDDELPKCDESVLLLIKRRNIDEFICEGYLCKELLEFVVFLPSMQNVTFDFWHICKEDQVNIVTHWMPLPDLPEEK